MAEQEEASYSVPASKGKKSKLDDNTGGPARLNDLTKEKERAKRLKGQSGVEGWKPEEWMKMRQNFDG
jgi:hypothetical protein